MNIPILEIAIGIILIYVVLAMVCSAVGEVIAQIVNMRAEMLWTTIRNMLGDAEGVDIAKNVYNHSLMRALTDGKRNRDSDNPNERSKPSYIPAQIFSIALMDHAIADSPTNGPVVDRLKTDINPQAIEALKPLLEIAGADFDQARKNIESWFDSTMQRAGGWYKRHMQVMLFSIGLIVAFALNADTIMLIQGLTANPAQASRLADTAAAVVKSEQSNTANPPAAGNENAAQANPLLSKASLELASPVVADQLGWNGTWNWKDASYNAADPHRFPNGFWEWVLKFLGLAFTAFALSLGGPFWFELLVRFVNIRSGGPAPNTPKDTTTRVSPPPPGGGGAVAGAGAAAAGAQIPGAGGQANVGSGTTGSGGKP